MNKDVPIEEINARKTIVWINKGIIDYLGFIYCESYLNKLLGGQWSFTYIQRNRKLFSRDDIYYQEFKFEKNNEK